MSSPEIAQETSTRSPRALTASLIRENRLLIVESFLRDAVQEGTLGRVSAALNSVANSGLVDPDLALQADGLEKNADALLARFCGLIGDRSMTLSEFGAEPIRFRLWVDQASNKDEEEERIRSALALHSFCASEKSAILGEYSQLRKFAHQLCDLIGDSIDREIDERVARVA